MRRDTLGVCDVAAPGVAPWNRDHSEDRRGTGLLGVEITDAMVAAAFPCNVEYAYGCRNSEFSEHCLGMQF